MASSTSDRRPYRLVVNKEWENIELGGDEWEGGGDSEAVDKEQGRTKKFTARKRIKVVSKGEQSTLKRFGKGKQILVDEESEEEYEGSEVGSEDSDCGDERREDCSDSELSEMRKVREEIRKENEALEQQQSQFIRDTLRKFGSKYNDYNSHSTGGSLDELYYEDSEDEDEEVAYAEPPAHSKKQRVNKIFNKKTAGKDIRWKAGLVFESKKELKDAVREVSIATGRPLQYSVDDKLRVQVMCAQGCPFKMWVSFMEEFEGWQIKTVNDEHNCIYHFNNKLVTVKYLAEVYGDKIRRNPNWKLTEMQEEIKKVLKVEICDAKACRVRQRALSGVQEEMKVHYAGLRRFGGEILRSNRANTVKICTTRQNEGDIPHFQRFYVCYDGLKKAWKAGCRPILGLDGCFLKTVCGGQLLSAVGRDGNNCIVPVAMAVVETESYDSWRWFLMLLVDDLELGNGFEYTFISDQQKGLEKAVKELLPHVEHRNCCRHIYNNLRKKHPTEAVKNCFWEAATATYPEAFKSAMKALEKHSKGAAERLREFDPKIWSKAYYGTHSKTESTENNISECFNSWILRSSYMPLIDMLTEIHDMIMERMHQKRDEMKNVDCILLPKVNKTIEDNIRDSAECKVLWDGSQNFQVKWRGIGYCVNLQSQTCSCRLWELTGIPCTHAISAIQKMRKNPYDFVSHWYTKATYMKIYSHGLEVLRGEPFWEEVEGDIIHPPPIMKKLRGRPKKQRRKEGWEGAISRGKFTRLTRVGRVMHCTICRKRGHNKGKCPQKPVGLVDKPQKKRGRKRKAVTEDEIEQEMEKNQEEVETGEAELMEEALRNNEAVFTQATQPSDNNVNAAGGEHVRSIFMPTPGLNRIVGFAGTPPASHPRMQLGTSKASKVKKGRPFTAPRRKK